jgi:hypothetical protein
MGIGHQPNKRINLTRREADVSFKAAAHRLCAER